MFCGTTRVRDGVEVRQELLRSLAGFGISAQDEGADFGVAAVADRVHAGDAFVHIEEGSLAAEEASVEAPRVAAGHEDRADQWQPDLSAVIVAGEHEVDTPILGLVEEVGGMAEQDAKIGRQDFARVDARTPGRCRAADREGQFIDVDGLPATFQDLKPGPGELLDHFGGKVLVVMISQNCEFAEAGFQWAENGLDPCDCLIVLDDVAGDEEEVRGFGLACIDDAFEEVAVEARGEMEVAELEDVKSVERRWQAGHPQLPIAKAELERVVSGEPQEPGAVTGTDQGFATLCERQVDGLGCADDAGRRSAQCQVQRCEGHDDEA